MESWRPWRGCPPPTRPRHTLWKSRHLQRRITSLLSGRVAGSAGFPLCCLEGRHRILGEGRPVSFGYAALPGVADRLVCEVACQHAGSCELPFAGAAASLAEGFSFLGRTAWRPIRRSSESGWTSLAARDRTTIWWAVVLGLHLRFSRRCGGLLRRRCRAVRRGRCAF